MTEFFRGNVVQFCKICDVMSVDYFDYYVEWKMIRIF